MMRFCLQIASVVLVAGSLMALPGCGSQPSAKKPADKPAAGHYEGDGHDHSKDKAGHAEGDGHDHSKDKAGHTDGDGHDHEKKG